MDTKSLAVTPKENGFLISISPEAEQYKKEALNRAKDILVISSTDDQQAAVAATAILKGLVNDTEKTRKLVKEPYLQAGKAIDAKAKEFVADLEKEVSRVEALIASYATEAAQVAQMEGEEAEKVSGASVTSSTDFEVSDMEAFYEWDKKRRADHFERTKLKLPSFVKMEVCRGNSSTHDNFKAFLNYISDEEAQKIPGIKITKQSKVSVRAVAPTLSLK